MLDGILDVAVFQKGLMAYNPAAKNWDTTLPRIPGLVPSAAFCAAYKGEVWVMGGYRDKGATPGAVWRYRPKSREWRAGPTLPMPLCWGRRPRSVENSSSPVADSVVTGRTSSPIAPSG